MQVLLDRLAGIKAGFDLSLFADMLIHLSRYADAELELGDVDSSQ